MKNKRIVVLIFGIVLALGVYTGGCSGRNDRQTQEKQETSESSRTEESKKESLKSFEAKTLDGGTFTGENIAQADVTIINFWSVTCGPCIKEMPDLAEFAKTLPDNVQVITACLDGEGSAEYAENLLREAGYEGITLISGDGDFQKISEGIQYIPTTVFVDKEGNISSDVIIGGQESLEKTFTEAVNAVLKAQGKEEIGDGQN